MDIWRDKIEPMLSEIEKWAANGVTETGCAANLHIDRKTWAKYRKAKKALRDALFQGQQRVAKQLRHALMESAIGGSKEEERVYQVTDSKGNAKTFKEKRRYYIPPNVNACNLLLRNLDRENWTETPATVDPARKQKEESATSRTDKEMQEIASRISSISDSIKTKASEIGIHEPDSTPD